MILHDISFIYNRTIIYIENNKWLHNEFCIIHRYKNCTIVITNWLTIMKYPFFIWQYIFFVLRRFIIPLSPTRLLPRLAARTQWGSYKKKVLLTLREHLGWPSVFCGVRVDRLFFCDFVLFFFFVCLFLFFFCFFFLSSFCVLSTMLPLNTWLSLRFSLTFT